VSDFANQPFSQVKADLSDLSGFVQLLRRECRRDNIVQQPLDAIRQEIRRYCVLPGEHEYNAVTLWAAATHLVDCFDYAPRLVIRSAVKRSGKSRLLEVVSEIVRDPLRTSNASTAYIYRALKDKVRTVLLDEADALFGTRTKPRYTDETCRIRGVDMRKVPFELG
jgi:hypothetical protein